MVGQGNWRGKKRFEGRFFNRFRCRTFVARVQIIVEEGAEIDFVEWIFVGFLCRDFGLGGGRCCGWFRRRFDGSRRGTVEVKPGIRFRAIRRNSRLGGCRSIHCFENGLIRRLRGTLRFEDCLDLFGRQLLHAVERFLEHRILGDFLRNHVLQLQAIELKDRHHLDESGRQDLLLRDSQLQSGRKH